jgi:hypothetical protein
MKSALMLAGPWLFLREALVPVGLARVMTLFMPHSRVPYSAIRSSLTPASSIPAPMGRAFKRNCELR